MRVAILDDYQELATRLADWSGVQARCDIVVFNRHLSEGEAADVLKDFDVICLLRERMAMPRALIERLPRLKLLAITGHKHRTLDLAAARERGIVVSHTDSRGSGPFATSELAWGLILSLARSIPYEANAMRAGGWQTTLGTALSGKRLGILGLGRLGTHMVPIARAFQMDVVAWSQNMTAEKAAAAGAMRVEKDELFASSDFVTLHVVLSERTRHIVGRRELALMKPSAYIVNTSRGPLIDRAALVEALRENRIAGAALDTFDVEPLPEEDELRRLPNAILTPHLGYTVKELLQVFYRDTVENVLVYLDGAPIRTGAPQQK
jgi:phosphoglycerate dehydrogenase-like enzyme